MFRPLWNSGRQQTRAGWPCSTRNCRWWTSQGPLHIAPGPKYCLQEYSKILFATYRILQEYFQNIVRANIARIFPICSKIIDVGTLGSSVRLCSEIVERVRTAVIPAEMVEKLTKSVKMWQLCPTDVMSTKQNQYICCVLIPPTDCSHYIHHDDDQVDDDDQV